MNKMINKDEMSWSSNKFSQVVLYMKRVENSEENMHVDIGA